MPAQLAHEGPKELVQHLIASPRISIESGCFAKVETGGVPGGINNLDDRPRLSFDLCCPRPQDRKPWLGRATLSYGIAETRCGGRTEAEAVEPVQK